MSLVPKAAKEALFPVLRAVFRLIPLKKGTRDRWRNYFLDHYSEWLTPPPKGRTDGLPSRRPKTRSDLPAIGFTPYQAQSSPSALSATLVAFYLPQFHPFVENDQWWGKGFTEWRNVARALPQFEGHIQPRLPGDLGFYDLRQIDVMRAQAALATEHGIGAFCFYFYWFAGKSLMEQPLKQWLADEEIKFSFCLCWANENWSRRWDGRDQDVLIAQQHSVEDDLAFITHIAPYLRDRRYLRVEDKPVLLVYRPHLMPNSAATAERWRQWCRENGVGEIHLTYVQGFECPNPGDIGFDAAVEFPPNMGNAPTISAKQRLINPNFAGAILDWRALAREMANRPLPSYRLYPGVNPGWDNEARRPGKSRILLHASPRAYGEWLQKTIHERLANTEQAHRIVFINAWNEWAESAVLEPDQRLGHAWLQQTLRAHTPPSPQPIISTAIVLHAWYLDALSDILPLLIRWRENQRPRIIVTTTQELAERVTSVMAAHGMTFELCVYENRGRDVLPFLHEADRLCNDGIQFILKIHTKRSLHRDDGTQWAKELLGNLLSGTLESCLQRFCNSPELGLLAPAGHLLALEQFLGGNTEPLDFLGARLGLETRGNHLKFASGSMFLARMDALRPVLDAHLSPEDFETESGQIDGTLAHALERAFGAAVHHAGYLLGETGSSKHTEGMGYRYADPSH